MEVVLKLSFRCLLLVLCCCAVVVVFFLAWFLSSASMFIMTKPFDKSLVGVFLLSHPESFLHRMGATLLVREVDSRQTDRLPSYLFAVLAFLSALFQADAFGTPGTEEVQVRSDPTKLEEMGCQPQTGLLLKSNGQRIWVFMEGLRKHNIYAFGFPGLGTI